MSSDTVGVQQVKCLVKHPTAALNYFQGQLPSFNLTSGIVDGGLMTDPANFEAISAVNLTQSNLTIEIVRDDDVNRFGREEQNLFLALNLQATTSDFDMTRAINVFAPDENITVRVDMAGSAGQSFNGNSGGEEVDVLSQLRYRRELSIHSN